jgi:pimeloyl-ACP methyl ester carboxylesterase
VQGIRTYARVGGLRKPGPPVVLVPGIGVSGRYFVPLARRLVHHAPTLAIDLAGAGRSGRPPHAESVPQLADFLTAWLDAVGIERAMFVGNSMGCQVLVDLASRRPERVDRLVLTSPTVDPRARTGPQVLVGLAGDLPHEPLSLVPILVLDYVRFGVIRFVQTGLYALRDRPEDKLPRIQAPTLVIRGDLDPLVPERWAEEVRDLLPHGRLAVLHGEPHACHYSAPGRVAELVLEERQQGAGDLGGGVEHRDVPGSGDDDDTSVS